MRYRPLSKERVYYLNILKAILKKGWPLGVTLAGPGHPPRQRGDLNLVMDADPRLSVVIWGDVRYAISIDRERKECLARPGQAIYWPPHAWNVSFWNKPCFYFGMVFRKSFVRYLVVDHPGRTPPAHGTPWAWHTQRPLSSVGTHLLRALNELAQERQPDLHLAQLLSTSLLHCARQHLTLDTEDTDSSQSRTTWQMALEYLNRNYADPMLSRESVAQAIGVHPNYLSAVATRQDVGFRAAMEAIRIDRAQYLLRKSSDTVTEIARQCGYASAIAFVRAFRRATGITPGTERRRRG